MFRILFALNLVWLVAGNIEARVIHVKPGADPENELLGESWNSATNLRRAIAQSAAGDQVWVKVGVYYPTEGEGVLPPVRHNSFRLKGGVAIFGGFIGVETSLAERNLGIKERTVLSGDIGKDDIDPDGDGVIEKPEDAVGLNSTRVVSAVPGGRAMVLDGVTVTAGGHGNSSSRRGGGMQLTQCSPTIRNCRFVGNFADSGPAIACDEASPTIVNCFFTGNEGDEGAACIYCDLSSPQILNCTFINNFGDAYDSRNAISCHRFSHPLIANCIVWNSAEYRFYDEDLSVRAFSGSLPLYTHCLLFGSGGSTAWQGGQGVDGGLNIDLDPKFVEGEYRLRADSPAVAAGRSAFLPSDFSDLDGDGNVGENLPFDIQGQPFWMSWPSGTFVDLGCFQYRVDEDSDLDGILDTFERLVTGDPLGLEIRVVEVSPHEPDYWLLTVRTHRNLRNHANSIIECTSSLDDDQSWRFLVSRKISSRAIGDDGIEDGYVVYKNEPSGFFRVRIEPK